MPCYLITATDTDAGKTLVSAALLAKGQQQGMTTLGIKPLAAGTDHQHSNPDARLIRHYSTEQHALSQHNPVCLHAAIAPHIAAQQEQQALTVARLRQTSADIRRQHADLTIIEGAGGWLVPLNAHETLADYCLSLNQPIILVVNARLGCLNHAQLSATVMLAQGAHIAGWISNEAQGPMNACADNMAYLQHWFAQHHIPHLGHIPHYPHLDPYCADTLQQISQLLRWP